MKVPLLPGTLSRKIGTSKSGKTVWAKIMEGFEYITNWGNRVMAIWTLL